MCVIHFRAFSASGPDTLRWATKCSILPGWWFSHCKVTFNLKSAQSAKHFLDPGEDKGVGSCCKIVPSWTSFKQSVTNVQKQKCEMFRLQLFTPVVTQICDRNWSKKCMKKVKNGTYAVILQWCRSSSSCSLSRCRGGKSRDRWVVVCQTTLRDTNNETVSHCCWCCRSWRWLHDHHDWLVRLFAVRKLRKIKLDPND